MKRDVALSTCNCECWALMAWGIPSFASFAILCIASTVGFLPPVQASPSSHVLSSDLSLRLWLCTWGCGMPSFSTATSFPQRFQQRQLPCAQKRLQFPPALLCNNTCLRFRLEALLVHWRVWGRPTTARLRASDHHEGSAALGISWLLDVGPAAPSLSQRSPC